MSKELQRAIFYCFKKQGIPGNVVKKYYDRYSVEYLIRKYWYLEYKIEQGAVKSPVGWLRYCIDNEISETDGFWDWWRVKRERVLDGDFDENIKAIAI